MRHSEKWKFKYRGIACEIIHHSVGKCQPNGIWCFYLTLLKNRFTNTKDASIFFIELQKGTKDRSAYYAYESIPLEMHGDVTFYERSQVVEYKKGLVDAAKIGCDYAHYLDEGCRYNEKMIQADAKKCVDEFLANGDYLICCDTDGELRLEKDVHYTDSEKSCAIKISIS